MLRVPEAVALIEGRLRDLRTELNAVYVEHNSPAVKRITRRIKTLSAKHDDLSMKLMLNPSLEVPLLDLDIPVDASSSSQGNKRTRAGLQDEPSHIVAKRGKTTTAAKSAASPPPLRAASSDRGGQNPLSTLTPLKTGVSEDGPAAAVGEANPVIESAIESAWKRPENTPNAGGSVNPRSQECAAGRATPANEEKPLANGDGEASKRKRQPVSAWQAPSAPHKDSLTLSYSSTLEDDTTADVPTHGKRSKTTAGASEDVTQTRKVEEGKAAADVDAAKNAEEAGGMVAVLQLLRDAVQEHEEREEMMMKERLKITSSHAEQIRALQLQLDNARSSAAPGNSADEKRTPFVMEEIPAETPIVVDEDNVSDLEQRCCQLSDAVATEQAAKEAAQAQLSEVRSSEEALAKDLKEANALVAEYTHTLEEKEKDFVKLKERIGEQDAAGNTLAAQQLQLKSRLEGLLLTVEELETSLSSETKLRKEAIAKTELTAKKNENAELRADELKGEVAALQEELAALQTEIGHAKADSDCKQRECDALREKFSSSKSQGRVLQERINGQAADNDRLKQALDLERERTSELRCELEVKKTEVAAHELAQSQARDELDAAVGRVHALEAELESVRSELEDSQATVATLRSEASAAVEQTLGLKEELSTALRQVSELTSRLNAERTERLLGAGTDASSPKTDLPKPTLNPSLDHTKVHAAAEAEVVPPCVGFSGFGSGGGKARYSKAYEKELIIKLEALGGTLFEEKEFTETVPTHLVTPPGVVTMKVLGASLSHSWLMKPEWLDESVKVNRLLPEDAYGVKHSEDIFLGKMFYLSPSFRKHKKHKQRQPHAEHLIVHFGKGRLVTDEHDKKEMCDFTLHGGNSSPPEGDIIKGEPLSWNQFIKMIPCLSLEPPSHAPSTSPRRSPRKHRGNTPTSKRRRGT